MAEGGSIAGTLLDAIKLKNYAVYVSKLNSADAMMMDVFHSGDLSTEYSLDTRICFNGNRINNSHMFEIFGQFSSTTANEVREDMIAEVKANLGWYNDRGRVVLDIMGYDIKDWVIHMKKRSVRGDELALYSMSKLYD